MDALCDGRLRRRWRGRGGGSGGSCSTSRRPGFTPATARACCRRTRWGRRCSRRIGRRTRGLALEESGVVGLLNVQYAIHEGRLYVIEGEPAGVADGAVRVEGGGAAAGEAGVPDHAGGADRGSGTPGPPAGAGGAGLRGARVGEGGGAAVRALRGGRTRCWARRCARRGGDRDRAGLPHRVAKAQAATGSPLPEAGRRHLGHRRRQGGHLRGRADPPRERLSPARHSGDGGAIARIGVPVRPLGKVGEGSPHVVDWIERGEVDQVVNTPTRSGTRTDGWQIRHAAVTHRIPCLTTLPAAISAGARSRGRRPRPRRWSACRSLHGERARRGLWEGGAPSAPSRTRGGRPGVTRRAAPFGRRLLRVTGMEELGAYRVLRLADPEGPPPRPGQFAMLAADEGGGGGGGAPYLRPRLLDRPLEGRRV